MKHAFVADVHVNNHGGLRGGRYVAGLNLRCRATLDSLSAAVRLAEAENCASFSVAGDLLDNMTPAPQMIAATGRAMQSDKLRVIVVGGNHDRASNQPGDNAFSWLGLMECAQSVERPRVADMGDSWHFHVPFQPEPPAEWLPGLLEVLSRERSDARPACLVIHTGIRDAETRRREWSAKATDAIDVELLMELCHKNRIGFVFAGNWHSWGQWRQECEDGFEILVTQCGALVPTGHDNPGLVGYGGVNIWDVDAGTVSRLEVPGPRFVVATSQAEVDDLAEYCSQLHVRFACQHEDADAANELCQAAKAAGKIADFTIRRNGVRSSVAKKAVGVARDVSTLSEALVSYVAGLELPATVNGQRVVERCAALLSLDKEDAHESP